LIIIREHAIEQFRNKMFDFSKSNNDVESILIEVAKKGKKVNNRPGALEIQYRDLSIVAKKEGDKTVVITFLGDSRYRAWYRRNKPSRKAS